MTAAAAKRLYRPRAIKRIRRTKLDMVAICDAICAEFKAHHPQTIRHVFYRLTVNGVIPKTAAAYNTVKRKSLDLRKDGVLPFAWVADNTRWIRRPTTYDSPEEAALACARDYRRALWRHSGVHVEVWSESDSIAGTIVDITDYYDVPLMVARGYASASFKWRIAQHIKAAGRPCHLYHVGDYDPSGIDIARDIEKGLREFAPEAEIHFETIAVTPEQIAEYDLPTKPPKASDSRTRKFKGGTVEVEALPVEVLQAIVRDAIEQHIDFRELEVIEATEQSEKQVLGAWARALGGAE